MAAAVAQSNAALLVRIQTEHKTSRATYGSPRIQVALQRQGVRCGHNRVARLMRLHHLQPLQPARFQPQTTQRAPGVVPAPNQLNRDFHADAPNQKWVSDFTYILTAEGWLYLAVVLDLFSRRVVSWAMSATMDTALVLAALRMALLDRQPPAGLLHHSD